MIKMMRTIKRRAMELTIPVILTTGIGLGIATTEYADWPFPFTKSTESGREKNSISTVVAGIVGQKMYGGDSKIDLEIQKSFWPDAKVEGYTTKKSIDTYVNLATTSARFNAMGQTNGLVGTVDKSEFDWDVVQIAPNKYQIKRFGLKFDAYLTIDKVANGEIKGTYERNGMKFDWDLSGTYDSEGNVKMSLDGPLNLGITLDGKITKR
jgi:hypothetical protein